MRIITVSLSLLIIACGISYLFYTQEVQYWLPTPVPENHKEVLLGTQIQLADFKPGKKKFIHFYNPNCPCSKFNLASYKALLKNYSEEFECYAVVQNTLSGVAQRDVDYLNMLNVSLVADKNKQIAKACGVYATPQIVLLDEENNIYYRGNYNQSRYCTGKTSNYAQIAIDSLLVKSQYLFPQSAYIAYGCTLEKHTD